jgi:hypothetical protein
MQARSQDAVAKQFIGVWRLVSTEQRLAEGTMRPSPMFGPDGVGYLVYSDTKRMCAILMDPARPKWVDPSSPTEQEVRSAMNGFAAYCGTYDVDAAEGSVVHHVELDKVPNMIGTDRKRFFTFHGNRLVLRLAPPLPEGILESSLTWERVKI